jgi:hypothetical protein
MDNLFFSLFWIYFYNKLIDGEILNDIYFSDILLVIYYLVNIINKNKSDVKIEIGGLMTYKIKFLK